VTAWGVLLCIYGALAFFTLGLVAAKGALLHDPPTWRYARSVLLAPFFVLSEFNSFGRVRMKVRENHRSDLLIVIKQRMRLYPDRDLRVQMLYILKLLDADESTCHWIMSDEWTKPIVAVRVRDAAIRGTDLVDFVAYMAAAAGMTEQEALELTHRLDKCYQKRRLPRARSLLN